MTAGIIGAAGYAGAELVRLLLGHPETGRLRLASVSHTGETFTGLYPNFLSGGGTDGAGMGKTDGVLETPEEVIAASDIVFGALPAGAGEGYAKACLERGVSYIDLSADFRFGGDGETYKAWYGKDWQYPALRNRCVYGLPELYRDTIKSRAASGPLIIGNPGCYPTAVTLAALPALEAAAPGAAIIADAVSGVTGAGRDPARAYHFPECSDSVSAYKAGAHRHTPEIIRNLAAAAGWPVSLVFTPHLGPLNRGILATVYIPLADAAAGTPHAARPASPETAARAAALRDRYAAFYKNERFVRILPEGVCAATNRVRLSNYCDISVHLDHEGKTLIAIAAIDNMVKGAAGQAVQNMNIIAGFDEAAGLGALPSLF
jgi:N-acetyl-gamma-glutamyl-phosphate reductase